MLLFSSAFLVYKHVAKILSICCWVCISWSN